MDGSSGRSVFFDLKASIPQYHTIPVKFLRTSLKYANSFSYRLNNTKKIHPVVNSGQAVKFILGCIIFKKNLWVLSLGKYLNGPESIFHIFKEIFMKRIFYCTKFYFKFYNFTTFFLEYA